MNIEFKNPYFPAADPFILLFDNKYYLYFTNEEGDQDGFLVYESNDLINWENKGYCLKKENVMGDKWFWAPEVIYYNNQFYMVYSSEEHLGIAISKSPLGPFVQQDKKWLIEDKAIDGHFFLDDDGKMYLYYAKLDGTNKIYASMMDDDLMSINKDSERLLIVAEEEWETKDALVVEGPFVLKYENKYYLTYSANHTRSHHYAVGYAVSNSPLGPFMKYENNPILFQNGIFYGLGHHSFTTTKDKKKLIIACHSHFSETKFKPRMLCLSYAKFIKDMNNETILMIEDMNNKID